jgi:hypothetical protein
MSWLHAERPSESTLAYSIEILLFSIIARRLRYVGEPVDVRAGLLGGGQVWAIINSVCLEMDEIKNENELWREAKLITKAAHLGLALEASQEEPGSHVVPGKTPPSNCSQSEICSIAAVAESEAA